MTLHTPNQEDIRKLHAEINQIINQRFLLTTLAVTIFGVIAAWLIPRERPQPGTEVSLFTYAGSILLLILLFVLFFFLHQLRAASKTLAAYLVVTQQSVWEQDWAEFRKKKYFGYTDAQAIVFLVLGLLAVAIPFLLALGFGLKLSPKAGPVGTSVVGVVYIILVVGMTFLNLFDNEEDVKKRWEELKENSSIPTTA